MPALPFKLNQDRRHHIPKQKHKVINSAAYDAALRQRGSLTVWFTDEAVAAWTAAPRMTRGGQRWYSPLAILTALTLRAVFRLALRQTEGLSGSIIHLLGLTLAVPDHTTLSRRAKTLEVPRPRPRKDSEPLHLLVDSTGLKLCGAGEWLVEKHGTKTRRSWRKLHLGLDADTGQIVAVALTAKEIDAAAEVGPLLDQVARDPWPRSPPTAHTTRRAFPPPWPSVTTKRRSSCRRVPRPCRAGRPQPGPRNATAIFSSSPSTGARHGRKRPDTAAVPRPRQLSAGSSR